MHTHRISVRIGAEADEVRLALDWQGFVVDSVADGLVVLTAATRAWKNRLLLRRWSLWSMKLGKGKASTSRASPGF